MAVVLDTLFTVFWYQMSQIGPEDGAGQASRRRLYVADVADGIGYILYMLPMFSSPYVAHPGPDRCSGLGAAVWRSLYSRVNSGLEKQVLNAPLLQGIVSDTSVKSRVTALQSNSAMDTEDVIGLLTYLIVLSLCHKHSHHRESPYLLSHIIT